MKNKLKSIVFTLPGVAVFLISIIILIRSLSARNAYEILLSSAALALWVVFCCAGAWTVRRLAALEPLWKPPLNMVTIRAVRVPRFFRLHFVVRGRFFPQGSQQGCPVFAETSLPRGSGTAGINLYFPLGGLFRGEGSCRLRDVFGFFSFPCGHMQKQTMHIRSAPCNAKVLRIEAQSGAEDRRNKTSSDEERYYMREYAPGDRFRDINWKSSDRIDTLITRISPDNQEKVTRIEVYFRNYGPSCAAIADLWLLDRAKARLAWFLRSVKEEKASYIFRIRSATGTWELNDQEQIDSFLEEIAVFPFSPIQGEEPSSPAVEGTGELYVFSTECDAGLPAFLLSVQKRPVTLFLAQGSGIGVRELGSKEAAIPTPLYLRDFIAGGAFPLPRWFLKRTPRQISVPGMQAAIDYAEVRL